MWLLIAPIPSHPELIHLWPVARVAEEEADRCQSARLAGEQKYDVLWTIA